MFASNDNIDPFSHTDQSILLRPFLSDEIDPNPNSKQYSEDLFFHFPSPYINNYYQELEDVFLHHDQNLFLHHDYQPLRPPDNITTGRSAESTVIINMEADDSTKTGGLLLAAKKTSDRELPRKRSCKRDRHSKINTAKGPRDRRMRLSLEVAKQFFGLQDMLGFDKASKTVEWLLTHAKHEIKKLNYSCSTTVNGTKSISSTNSECEEVVSGLLIHEEATAANKGKGKGTKPSSIKEKKSKQKRKSTVFRPLAKDKREKARERARKRTTEKNRSLKCSNDMNNQLGCWSPFETAEESGTQTHNIIPSTVAQVEEPSRDHQHIVDVDQFSLAMMNNKWSPSSIVLINYHHNNGIPQEEHDQFTDFQFFDKPWEAYNNQNLC